MRDEQQRVRYDVAELLLTRINEAGPDAAKFFHTRLKKDLDKNPDKEPDKAIEHALLALLVSDVPLDRDTRFLLAGLFSRLWFPRSRQDQRREENAVKVLYYDDFQRYLRRELKMRATDAEAKVAATFGLEVDALRQARRRARKWQQRE